MNTNPPLETVLRECSLHSLLMLVSKALTRTGYGDVEILDRRHARQKSRYGGHEIVCYTTLGSVPAKVVVKVINDVVRVRMLDELAGVVDRQKADIGLIVTPWHASDNALNELKRYCRSRIEILDGNAIAQILVRHKIGVRPKGDIDYAFFAYLEHASEEILGFIESQKE